MSLRGQLIYSKQKATNTFVTEIILQGKKQLHLPTGEVIPRHFIKTKFNKKAV